MSQTIAVIGGGPAGLEAARGVAELGGNVVLVEKEAFLGGTPIREHYATLTPHFQPAEEAMGVLIEGVTSQPSAEVLLEHEVTACEGEAPDFRLTGLNAPTVAESSMEARSAMAFALYYNDPVFTGLMKNVLANFLGP